MNIGEAYSYAFSLKKSKYDEKMAKYNADVTALENSCEELKNISLKLSSIGSKIALTALSGDKELLAKYNADSTVLFDKKLQLLKKNNIKTPQYDCQNCSDTGYNNGEVCDCIKKIAIEYLLNSAQKKLPLDTCSFEKFDLNYYAEENEGSTTPKKRMTNIFKFLKEYTINFNPKKSESLIFFGNTGTGKTHLSLSVFQDVLKKGYNATYDTAFNLFSKIENEHFKSSENETFDDAITVDLLIIDDLGSEFVSAYSRSAFLNIIDTRLLAKKPTIINTNLSVKELEEKYSPRVSSRIMGEFTAKKFLGTDIRQQKKLEKK